MQRVSILTTDTNASNYAPFENGEAQFVFGLLTASGPSTLVEGRAWVFVDWVMDDLSGLEMVRRLRADARTADVHITMMLERDDHEERRRALQAGADDYAVAPLERQAILDRVLVLHGDAGSHTSERILEHGDLVINIGGEQARWMGQPVPLRPNEFRVLRFFVENPDRVFSREELIGALGKAGDPAYTRTVDVWIKRLRFGLRQAGVKHLLRTVHGKGYVLDKP